MLDKNREVLSPSVPSLYWHKSFAPYQAGYVCLPSPSIQPCSSVPSQHTRTEDSNTLSEKLCQEEKKKKLRNGKNETNYAKRKKRNHTFFVFCNSPFPTISCGNGAFRLALHPGLLDFAIKWSHVKKSHNYENVITVVWADLCETHLMFVKWELIRGTQNRHFWMVACFHFHVHYGYCKFRVGHRWD